MMNERAKLRNLGFGVVVMLLLYCWMLYLVWPYNDENGVMPVHLCLLSIAASMLPLAPLIYSGWREDRRADEHDRVMNALAQQALSWACQIEREYGAFDEEKAPSTYANYRASGAYVGLATIFTLLVSKQHPDSLEAFIDRVGLDEQRLQVAQAMLVHLKAGKDFSGENEKMQFQLRLKILDLKGAVQRQALLDQEREKYQVQVPSVRTSARTSITG